MTGIRSIGAILVLSLLVLPVLAQDEDAERYTYATYFHCDAELESRADSIMQRNARTLDGLVADGTILAWGWRSHHTGGDWRRIRYHQAASPEAAMEALDVMGAAIAEAHGEDDEAGSEFSEIRGPNVDYVWSIVHEKQ